MLKNRPRSPAPSLLAALGLCAATLLSTNALASQALAQRYACIACHQPTTKTVGPSWKDIRTRYGDGTTTAAQLATTIKAGSSGKWGAMPMPPQSGIPEADAQTLAQWVLDGPRP